MNNLIHIQIGMCEFSWSCWKLPTYRFCLCSYYTQGFPYSVGNLCKPLYLMMELTMLLFIITGRLKRYNTFVYSKCIVVVWTLLYTNHLETVNLTSKVSFYDFYNRTIQYWDKSLCCICRTIRTSSRNRRPWRWNHWNHSTLPSNIVSKRSLREPRE